MLLFKRNQPQKITFVMVNAAGTEVEGLGNALLVDVSKNGAAFAAGVGVAAEIGHGWYAYTLTVAETDTIGPLSVRVNGAGCQQQNLWYAVESMTTGAIEFTYTVTDVSSSAPIPDVEVWITTDLAGTIVVWAGKTNAFGIAVDETGALPLLAAGTYFFWRNKIGYEFTDPDTEVVS
jgi:hypothetical protein